MGTDSEFDWPDEKPAHLVRVDAFWMDETEITNAQFRAFVEATGYLTTAEKPPDAEEILRQLPPGTPAPAKEKLVPLLRGVHGDEGASALDCTSTPPTRMYPSTHH